MSFHGLQEPIEKGHCVIVVFKIGHVDFLFELKASKVQRKSERKLRYDGKYFVSFPCNLLVNYRLVLTILSTYDCPTKWSLLASRDHVVVDAAASSGITSKLFVHTLSHD